MNKNLCLLLTIITITGITSGATQELELDSTTNKALSRNATITKDAQGQTTLETNGGFQSATFVRINKTGETETLCTTSKSAAKLFLTGKSLTKTNGEQK
ncbi:MAG: hypothetical protein L3J53_06315 [Proteobacteria bacterium]|nr:hypothetical protein [Pseudomonadota bacterium]